MERNTNQKEKWKEWLCLILTSLLLPCILTLLISGTSKTSGGKTSGIQIAMEDGTTIDMEEFLVYALAGQIDLDAPLEALKAQCVIARTNLMRELNGAKSKKADEISLTYLTPSKFENSFGETKKEEVIKKLTRVVAATFPYVITYDGEYIEALYHYVSTGTTVSSEEMFGKGRPYLIAVESSRDVESEEYMTLSAWTGKELLSKLQGMGIGKDKTTDTIFSALKISEKTKNGYVKEVTIGKERMSGEEWKSLFGLNSTHFYLEEQDGQLRMIVLGKGHGVGLSQYGAIGMAKEGKKWREILLKYYPGAEVEK